MSEKPKRWTWEEWCEQWDLDEDDATEDYYKEMWDANEPYIEWLEAENAILRENLESIINLNEQLKSER